MSSFFRSDRTHLALGGATFGYDGLLFAGVELMWKHPDRLSGEEELLLLASDWLLLAELKFPERVSSLDAATAVSLDAGGGVTWVGGRDAEGNPTAACDVVGYGYPPIPKDKFIGGTLKGRPPWTSDGADKKLLYLNFLCTCDDPSTSCEGLLLFSFLLLVRLFITSSILVRFGLVLRHRFCAAVVRPLKHRKVWLEFLSFPLFLFENTYLHYIQNIVLNLILTIYLLFFHFLLFLFLSVLFPYFIFYTFLLTTWGWLCPTRHCCCGSWRRLFPR